MKQFLLRLFGFACFLFVILSLITGVLVLQSKYSHIYLDEYGHKEYLFDKTPSPRVIFLGGSNVAFGIDSRAVAESLDVNVVNFGLQLGIGMRKMMSDALRYCKKGDILVIAPEYENFYGIAYGGKETIALLSLLYPKVVVDFNMEQARVALSGLKDAIYVMSNLDNWRIVKSPKEFYPYNTLSFNSFGDEERHWTSEPDQEELTANHITFEFDEDYFDEFFQNISILEARGVDVVIIPPSVSISMYEESTVKMMFLEGKLAEAGHPFAFPQESCVYEREDMFDTYYHLSRSGIDKRMPLIIDVLRQHIHNDVSGR